jgi:hypothetical protein
MQDFPGPELDGLADSAPWRICSQTGQIKLTSRTEGAEKLEKSADCACI